MEQHQKYTALFEASDKETQAKLRVLIVDDHRLVGEVVADFLTTSGYFVAELAETLNSALDKLRTAGSYDIVMLELALPGMVGTSGIGKIVKAANDGSVVLFTSHVDRFTMDRALELGVKGVIPKTLPLRSLISALRVMRSGEVFLPTMLHNHGISENKQSEALTEIELVILRFAAEGFTDKWIADAIDMKVSTVKSHIRSIFGKLNARNRAHASMIALDLGLLAR